MFQSSNIALQLTQIQLPRVIMSVTYTAIISTQDLQVWNWN